jgi:GTP-binding protein HflX
VPATGRALVLVPELRRQGASDGENGDSVRRESDSRLEEAVGLALAIDLDVAHREVVRLARIVPATYLGSGVVERFHDLIDALDIDVVVVDAALSPVQQRNLERGFDAKVIDRTALILEIFGARARTHEGRLQVELAALDYQRSRLVRSWTHLERQRGGFGFLGGPGESQLEIDRRLIGERMARLRRELEGVQRTRALHRRVGYTNAGKSTLFNRLAQAGVFAEDLLFATLDPTMRQVVLPSGQRIILSDTVGFISQLPTHLVAAFRATLEEVAEADLVLHVRDVSHPETEIQKTDVEAVLAGLDLPEGQRRVEVLNKIDLLEPAAREMVLERARRDDDAVAVSAITGEGCDALLDFLGGAMAVRHGLHRFRLDLSDGAALAWLYAHGNVVDREDREGEAMLQVSLDPADLARFEHRFGKKPLEMEAELPAGR